MQLKNVAVKGVGGYLMLDALLEIADAHAETYQKYDEAKTSTKIRQQVKTAKDNKGEYVKGGVGATLLGINWEKPMKEAVNGKPKRRNNGNKKKK